MVLVTHGVKRQHLSLAQVYLGHSVVLLERDVSNLAALVDAHDLRLKVFRRLLTCTRVRGVALRVSGVARSSEARRSSY